MELKEQFQSAQERVKSLTQKPANDELLELYALYKQATEGDNTGEEPNAFDFKAKFKWNTWNSKKGLSSEDAMQQYVALVETLIGKYSNS
ncbi:MAG: acyl-CoA-binding protein [Bacteroidetes bacterium]|nr:acyl-CoA-binding protein [Bacteroidota bacterium]